MKKLFFSMMLSLAFLATSTAQEGIERTGFDGDFFSLEGAIDVFKKSNSIEDFERRLNKRDNWVNNLDLNYDGRTDYIRVEHRSQGDFHAIILQVPISRRELQDVAVIEIEKTGRRSAILQIVGDEYLYGEEVIVEPYEGYTTSGGYSGPNAGDDFKRRNVNVYYWSAFQHILGRRYRAYVSPYRWQYYPTWWSPWQPCGWNIFYPRIRTYRSYYHVVYVHRVRRVHNFYRPYRASCPAVYQRTNQVKRTTNWQPRRERVARNNAQVNRGNSRANTNRNNRNDRPSSTTRRNEQSRTSSVNKGRANNNVNQSRATTKSNNNRGSSSSRYEPSTKTNKSRATSKSSQRNTRSTKSSTSQRSSSSANRSTNRSSSTNRSTNRSSSSAKRSSSRSSTPSSRSSSSSRRSSSSKKTTTRGKRG